MAACTPRVRIADPGFNLAQILELARRADQAHCVLAVFPETRGVELESMDKALEQKSGASACCGKSAGRRKQA